MTSIARNGITCLVALEELGDELTFPVSRHLQALDLARGVEKVALVVALALATPGVGVSSL